MSVSVTSRLDHRSEWIASLTSATTGTTFHRHFGVRFVTVVSGYVFTGATVLRAVIRQNLQRCGRQLRDKETNNVTSIGTPKSLSLKKNK